MSTLGTSQKPLSGEVKVLGIRWNISDDQLVFDAQCVVHVAEHLE